MQKTNAKKCLSDSPSQKNATTERIFSELPAKDARHGIRFGTHAFFPRPRRSFVWNTLREVRLYLLIQ
jgi:hypothetical protein